MKFRSCDCHLSPDFDPWAEDTLEGAFQWGSVLERDDPSVPCIKIVVPYDHPANCHSLHILKVVPSFLKETLNEEGQVIEKKWEPLPGAVIPRHRPWWHWDGNKEKPTLHPSIACGIDAENWHGHLRNGRMVACE